MINFGSLHCIKCGKKEISCDTHDIIKCSCGAEYKKGRLDGDGKFVEVSEKEIGPIFLLTGDLE